MFGRRPYKGKDRKEIRDNILLKQIKIKKNDIPAGWSVEAVDFINRLIQRKPISRLGVNGPSEVKSHPWFHNFDWDSVLNKTAVAPFIPPNEENFDFKYANESWKDENSDLMKQQSELIKQPTIQALFNGYYYMVVPDGSNVEEAPPASNNDENEVRAPASSDKTTRSNSFLK